MKNLYRNLILSTGIFIAFVFAVQAPFLGFNNHNIAPDSFVQPSCTDFTRWVINPGQYQCNDEFYHGLGLIPAPVDRSVVPFKTSAGAWQSKIIVPVTGKTRFVNY